MSDTSQGDGWWQASDGKWYPPQPGPGDAATQANPTAAQPPAAQPPTTQQPAAQPGSPQAAAVPPDGPVDGDGAALDPEAEAARKKKKRNTVIAVVVVLLLLAAAAIGAFVFLGGDDDDDDSKSSTSTTEKDIGDATGDLVDDGPIEFNTEYRDKLEGTRTEGRFTLDAPAGAIMTLVVTNETASERPVYATFTSGGDRFAGFRVQPNAEGTEKIMLDNEGAAPFELNFTEGPAEFTFRVDLELQNDAGEGGDAGTEFADAFAVTAGQEVGGLLGGEDTTDRYTIDLESGSQINMSASVDRSAERGAYFTVELDGDRLFGERVQPGAETTFTELFGDTDSGTLEIIVTEGPANYAFLVNFEEQEDGGSPGDAPAELADARTADPAAPIAGKVGGRDTGDYFTFDAPAPTVTVTATVDARSDKAAYFVFEDDSGSRLAGFRVQPGSEGSETFEVPAGAAVRMIVTEGTADYSVAVS